MGSAPSINDSIDSVATDLAKGRYKNVIIMCGAGISTNAGVPDFRTPSVGLYYNVRKLGNLPYPEAVFDIDYFRKDPIPFYTLVRRLFPETLEPTDTHKFFGLLHKKGILKRVYTQNIDALESLAGVPEKKIVEAHGTFKRAFCTDCGYKYDLRWLKNAIFRNKDVPRCEECNGVVRPDIVFFGENLPNVFWSKIKSDFERCDCLIVLGTSLAVAPFNGLVNKVRSPVPRIYINNTAPGRVGILGYLMGLGVGSASMNSANDLIYLEDCDRAVRYICQVAGWGEDLSNIQTQILEP